MSKIDGVAPMDVSELLQCVHCGEGMMHGGALSFYEITVGQCVIDTKNVQRMHGMEMMFGGAAGIARAMSPDNTVAHRMGEPRRILMCQECALHHPQRIAVLSESE